MVWGCAPGAQQPGATSDDTAGTTTHHAMHELTGSAAADDTGDGGAETDDTGVVEEPSPCPEGMSAVTDTAGEVAWCIDTWENRVDPDEGELGNLDQGAGWPDGSTTAVAWSLEGVEPTKLVSWYQAQALCHNVNKALCTTEQWVDACDGQVGEGGRVYPWGDGFDPGACVTLDAAGAQQYDDPLPTGSLASCASAFGVMDMAGNLWEWTDPGTTDDAGLPLTHKVGGASYAGGGNYPCGASPVTDHDPDFIGTIGFRCCAAPLR